MKGIGALRKGTSKSSINPFPFCKIHLAISIPKPQRGPTPDPDCAGTLIWDFQSAERWAKIAVIYKLFIVSDILLQQLKLTVVILTATVLFYSQLCPLHTPTLSAERRFSGPTPSLIWLENVFLNFQHTTCKRPPVQLFTCLH